MITVHLVNSIRFITLSLVLIVMSHIMSQTVLANEDIYKERLSLYKKTATITDVPWYYLAAFDQYERNMQTPVPENELISFSFPDALWYGIGNPSHITDVRYVHLFQGIGKDGNGDGLAEPTHPEDALLAAAALLTQYGTSEDDIKISLWRYYQRDLSVKTIVNTASVYKHFETNALLKRDFPVATTHNFSYRSTWGQGRGFGGRRIHEGTDIFASYGTPVKSTTYGVVELKGWNLYGGWRIGIRDIHNIYHYYAHLNSYAEDIKIGDIVEPGDLLGTVGSSGYGPPGTAGKFPPHLHYGMYKDNGHNEWSFDPFPHLKKWQQMAKDK